MSYSLIEPVWNGKIDTEEIRDADEDEQMNHISVSFPNSRYYDVANGPDIEFYKKKLEKAKECLKLPDDYEIPGYEWRFDRHQYEGKKFIIGDEYAFDTNWMDALLPPEFFHVESMQWPLNVEDYFHIKYDLNYNKDLPAIEITPLLRKELREKRVEFYKEYYEYFMTNDLCEAPDDVFDVENCCSFEKIDSCYCGFDKNKYACILTPCCRHKMHLRCLYAWKEKKEEANPLQTEREPIEHCPYCRANWDDAYGLYPAQ
jgi:hypothetical protein